VGASTDVTAQREAEEMRGRLTEQLSAAALRTARLQQATSMLAEALTVEQVVQVITEVGRSAVGAERSAVAVLDPDRLRLRVVNDGGLPDSDGAHPYELPLSAPSVMTAAIQARRPLLLENPDALRRLFEDSVGVQRFLEHSDEKAWVGLPLLSSGASIGALRFSFTRPRQITEEERVFLEALAGQCALARAGDAVRARAHHGRDAAAQPAAGQPADGPWHDPGGQVHARDQEHGDRRGLVRRLPAARWPARGRHRRRHGQGPDRGGRDGPGT
jgi:transcriptional regulator with GAF, ATPase, and Fis domain